jgi:RNA polymerase sigma-70 factor (ECF subfamily)
MEKEKNIHSGITGNMAVEKSDMITPTIDQTNDVEFFIRKTFETDPLTGCELLFKNYYQPMCSHAVRFVFSKSIAEDLVSDIFYQFYHKKVYLSITTSFRAYLYKSVRHSAYNYLKWECNRTSPIDAASNFSDLSCAQPDNITQYEDLYSHVEKAIKGLPPQRQKIYLMHRFEGKKYKEIAEELSLSQKTVEAQIKKASDFIRDLLKGKWLS